MKTPKRGHRAASPNQSGRASTGVLTRPATDQAAKITLFVTILTYVGPIEEIDAAGAEHVAWLQRGYDEGVFLVSGRRIPRTGGVILAKGSSRREIEERMRDDPFQRRGLATAEIIPFEPNMLSDAVIIAGAFNKTSQTQSNPMPSTFPPVPPTKPKQASGYRTHNK